jgi:RNA polymerase sigma-70 factor (ECF subfamily)
MFTDNQLITEMDRLKRFAWKLTRNNADADDLLQNTVLRAYEKKHLFQEGSNVFSWTSKIMYNIFVTDYRRKVKFESQYDPEPYLEKQQDVVNHEDTVMMNEVSMAMKQLSDEHRNILVMITIQGMKYDEAAEKLNIPVGTVRSRLSRARNTLMELLENKDGKPGFSISTEQATNYPIAA